jgi:hypothetical protein
MDEQEEEDGIMASLAPPALMPNLCKPIVLEAATLAVGSGAVHPDVSTPHRHGGAFRITTPCPSSDATPTTTSTGGTSARGRATKRTGDFLPTTNYCKKMQKMAQKINEGVRIKITHDRLYNICASDQQARLPTSAGNSYNVYGTVIQGSSGKCGRDVQFYVFPLENHTVKKVSRNKIAVLSDGDAEVEYDREVDLSDHPSTFLSPTPLDKQKKRQEEFLIMDDDDTAHTRSFKYQWGKAASEVVDWKILVDDETVDLRMPDVEGHKATSDIRFDDEAHLSDIFFQSIFPSIEGHAAKLDAYLSNDKADL